MTSQKQYEADVQKAREGLHELIDPVADVFGRLATQGVSSKAFLDAWIWFVATGTVNFTRSTNPEHQLEIDEAVDEALINAISQARFGWEPSQ